MRKEYIFFVTIFCFLSTLNATESDKWFHLFPDETYVTDFELKGKESKEIKIEAKKRTLVSFQTNVSSNDSGKYKLIDHPIKMIQKNNSVIFCSSATGSGTYFKPIDSVISLIITNNTDDQIKIVIMKKKE